MRKLSRRTREGPGPGAAAEWLSEAPEGPAEFAAEGDTVVLINFSEEEEATPNGDAAALAAAVLGLPTPTPVLMSRMDARVSDDPPLLLTLVDDAPLLLLILLLVDDAAKAADAFARKRAPPNRTTAQN